MTATSHIRQKKTTFRLLAPGVVWMILFLIAPIMMIVYVSFWTQTTFAINSSLTLDSWRNFFASEAYVGALWTTIRLWLIVLTLTFVIGYPAALYVGLMVKSKTISTVLLVLCVRGSIILRTFGDHRDDADLRCLHGGTHRLHVGPHRP